jgi:hypothetical protein
MAESMVEYQTAFLLLQLLGAEAGRLSKGEANKGLTKGGNQRLGLTKAKDANTLRDSLCPIHINKSRGRTDKGGSTDYYELTDQGKSRLLEVSFYPLEIQIPGRAIQRLRDAAGGERKPERGVVHPAQPNTPAGPSLNLEQEILRIFEELRRERYHHTGLVPIPELRRSIRARHGEAAARHDVLDAKVLDLWRGGRLRLVPINDGRNIGPDEIGEGIPGAHETWFYLESAS